MNKIAVNPTQFITCRLCLEELGNYQIVPSVKEQIEYCFGIKIEPFDGFSQLLCEKCEEILSNYSKIKKKFIEKQDELKDRVYNNSKGSLEKLSDAQQSADEPLGRFDSDSNKENVGTHTKRKRYISSSSSDLEYDKRSRKKRSERGSNSSKETDVTWPKSYTKQFVCRMCDSIWSNVKLLRIHIKRSHSALHKKYGHILRRQCQVILNKSDGKPNVTGTSEVVYSKEKIIKNINADYHIIYTIKRYKGDDKPGAPHVEGKTIIKKESSSNSESSDEDLVVKRKKRKHFYSSSSSETVVLNESNESDNDDKESQKYKKVQSPAACIDLDDSSEAESEKSMNPIKKAPDKQLLDKDKHLLTKPSIHQDIMMSCRNKYVKKHYQDTNSTKSHVDIANKLQHKIFSIGRKIINKSIGVNCTPLLRFMEHKNLDIAWIPREIVNVSQESNYIRIMPRRKNCTERVEHNVYLGWKDLTPNQICNKSKTSTGNKSDQPQNPLVARNGIANPDYSSDAAAVLNDANLHNTDTKKLLNENPVANPKQLPKKFVTSEVKKSAPVPTESSSDDGDSTDLCMPIITSTISLAAPLSIQDDNDGPNKRSEIDSTSEKQQPEAPRIKVKPVSELMSAETLNRMQTPTQSSIQNPVQNSIQTPIQNSMQSPIHIPYTIISKGLPLSVQNVSGPVLNPYNVPLIVSQNLLQGNKTTNLCAQEPLWQNVFVLDTVEMPNTTTSSPFLYLKNLLQMHAITLLDTNVELSNEFHCLIKFKVQFKQDAQYQPVILCLALFCSNNIFCLKVKDRNNEDLDLTKVSANWQWEVLKIYKGEVVDKLLHNARKVSQEVYEFTNSFLCILKSINVKRMS